MSGQRKTHPHKKKHSAKQVFQYFISGGAYFWSGYAAFFILDHVLHLSLFSSRILSNGLGLTVNFLLQHYWVFGTHKSSKKLHHVTSKYAIITALNFLIDYLIVRELYSLGISPYIGTFVSSGFMTVWNYYGYKYWVFAHD